MNFGRLFRTAINLKPIQIVYQIKYRTIGYTKKKTISYPDIDSKMNISVESLDEDDIYVSRFKPEELLDNILWLLNDMEQWRSGKWNYSERTHLWNFNLHYFEYGIALASKFKSIGDIKYYQKLEELYRDWHNTCFGDIKGDAWHPYTISLRIKNLLVIYGILEDKKDDWLNLIREDISEQYQFLMNNQEKNLLGNHYFENLTTLYICSRFFNDRQNTVRFRNDLLYQINEQILPDGMHFERSFMYHNLILEDLIRIYQIADGQLKQVLKNKIQVMTNCVYSFEDEYRLPLFNDTGSNVAKRRSQLINAARSVSDAKEISCNSLQVGGYYRLETGKLKMIVDAGAYAPIYISGHGHCDMLSFELFYDDEPLLVNAGTYQYQSRYRKALRSTFSHNTFQVDGVEQSEIWGEHRTGRIAKIVRLVMSERCIEATFQDYQHNNLIRSIRLDHGIVIESTASKPIVSYWHIYPGNLVKHISEGKLEIITPKGNRLFMKTKEGGFIDITENSIYSEEFGEYRKLPSFSTKAHIIEITDN